MVPLGGVDQNDDFAHDHTQLLGSQSSSLSFSEDVNETQVLSLGGETQVFDVGGETQVLDDGDFLGTTNTQVLVGFDDVISSDRDGYETDGTEVMYDSDQLFDGKPSREGCQLLGEASIQRTSPCNQGNSKGSSDHFTSLANGKKNTEHAPRFTSVRVSSLRASGLAALDLSPKRTNSHSSPLPIEHQFQDKHASVGNSDGHWIHDGQLNGPDNLYDGRTRSPTARRLFYEGVSPGGGVSQDMENFDETECLAGLSYVNSQEPGELSQANALNFVERFIDDNMAECNIEVDHGKSAGRVPKPISNVKGLQSLARKNAEGGTVGSTGIFDWDDGHEDDGGGGFFCRKKEDLLGKGGQTRKSSIDLQGPGRKKVGKHMGACKKSNDSSKRIGDPASKLTLQKSEGESKTFQEIHHPPDFTRQFKEESSIEHLEVTVRMTNAQEFSDVGFDTQMAAEAMEVLSFGIDVPDNNTNDVQQALQIDPTVSDKASRRGKNGCSRQPVSTMEVHEPDIHLSKGRLRKAKKSGPKSSERSSVTLPTCSMDVRECDIELQEQEKKCAGRDTTEKPHYTDIQLSRASKAKGLHYADGELENIRSSHYDNSFMKLKTMRYTKRKRSCLKRSGNVSKSDNMDAPHQPSASPRDTQEALSLLKKSTRYFRSNGSDLSMRKSSDYTTDFSLINGNMEGTFPHQRPENQLARVDATCCNRESTNGNLVYSTLIGAEAENHTKNQVDSPVTGGSVAANANIDNSPKRTPEQSPLLCTTPVSCVISPKSMSSICTKDDCFKRSCRKNLSGSFLVRELVTLSTGEQESISPSKDTRKRRNLTEVRVLLSQHLDEDICRQQKKIMVRLGISEVSTIADATHFIADNFMRTRNMLEAIAGGKLVVTHLWLESVGQVNIHIDEEPYILRDIKKEKEFGFCMPVSLAQARKCPLLQDRNVFITPNVKPGKDTILCLVSAVHGEAVEGTDRSALKCDRIPDDLLILSCEEDYEVCVPLLKKGASVYSSELLLNGIVTQKLEYESLSPMPSAWSISLIICLGEAAEAFTAGEYDLASALHGSRKEKMLPLSEEILLATGFDVKAQNTFHVSGGGQIPRRSTKML